MKIKYLEVTKYKNLRNLKLDFESDLISLLVGRNGLGKSNLIEILALIFRDLDLLEKEEQFEFWSYDPEHFEYLIQYECKKTELWIECNTGGFNVRTRPLGSKDGFHRINFTEFKKRKREDFLPRYVIGYYSGENKRIGKILRKYEEEVWKDLKSNKDQLQGFRRMFFAENHHAQLVLLTLLLYQHNPPSEDFKKRVDELITKFTTFKKLESIELHLKEPIWYSRKGRRPDQKSIMLIESNILEGVEFPFWNARGRADKAMTFFYDNNRGAATYYADENDKLERLRLNSIDRDKVATKVNMEFGEPANFLDAIESLYVIDAIEEIVLTVTSENREATFSFTDLSEGEQQLITVIGLLLIAGREDCLFLFDEPDTHLNPAWQRNYVELLKNFNLEDTNSHIIVATHSPLIVQAAKDADVFLFRKSDGQIEALSENFKISNWRIDQVLLSEYFDLYSARPPHLDEYMNLRIEVLSKTELSEGDMKRLKEYENEYGSLPTGETIQELEALQLISSVVKEVKNDKN